LRAPGRFVQILHRPLLLFSVSPVIDVVSIQTPVPLRMGVFIGNRVRVQPSVYPGRIRRDQQTFHCLPSQGRTIAGQLGVESQRGLLAAVAHDVLQGLDGRPSVGKVLGEALVQNVQRQPAVRDVVVRQARNNGRRNSADSILDSGGD
jgi:hypothetical protein